MHDDLGRRYPGARGGPAAADSQLDFKERRGRRGDFHQRGPVPRDEAGVPGARAESLQARGFGLRGRGLRGPNRTGTARGGGLAPSFFVCAKILIKKTRRFFLADARHRFIINTK